MRFKILIVQSMHSGLFIESCYDPTTSFCCVLLHKHKEYKMYISRRSFCQIQANSGTSNEQLGRNTCYFEKQTNDTKLYVYTTLNIYTTHYVYTILLSLCFFISLY